jgi:hypothetical protein
MAGGTMAGSLKDNLKDAIKTASLLVASCLTFGIAAVGACEVAKALIIDLGLLDVPTSSNSTEVIPGILKGLECIFLSPMPLLLMFSIRDLIYTYQADQKSKNMENIALAHEKLMRLKGVMISLMATTLAAELLEKSFESVSIVSVMPQLIIMVLLIAYAFVIGRLK